MLPLAFFAATGYAPFDLYMTCEEHKFVCNYLCIFLKPDVKWCKVTSRVPKIWPSAKAMSGALTKVKINNYHHCNRTNSHLN